MKFWAQLGRKAKLKTISKLKPEIQVHIVCSVHAVLTLLVIFQLIDTQLRGFRILRISFRKDLGKTRQQLSLIFINRNLNLIKRDHFWLTETRLKLLLIIFKSLDYTPVLFSGLGHYANFDHQNPVLQVLFNLANTIFWLQRSCIWS